MSTESAQNSPTPEASNGLPALSDEERALLESAFEHARAGNTAALSSVLAIGVPANLTNEKGDTLLILAAYYSHAETVSALLNAGADTDRVNDRGQTALSAATFRKDEGIARALLSAGADPRAGEVNAAIVAEQFGLDSFTAMFAER